jgi:prevent-host-death family protein
MGKHSIAEARDNLSKLIDRALEGEDVVLTRHGQPVVTLKPVKPTPGPLTRESLEWLRAIRVKPKRITEDAATLVRRMRDEEDH